MAHVSKKVADTCSIARAATGCNSVSIGRETARKIRLIIHPHHFVTLQKYFLVI